MKTGKDAPIGTRGVATIDLKPKCEVHVMGEFWEATAKDTSIAAWSSGGRCWHGLHVSCSKNSLGKSLTLQSAAYH